MSRLYNFNPFLRTRLLESIVDSHLLDIRLSFSTHGFSEVKNEEELDQLVQMAKAISLHFSNGIVLRFMSFFLNDVGIRAIRFERDLFFQRDQLQFSENEQILNDTITQTFSISIFEQLIAQNAWTKSELNVQKSYLLTETQVFKEKYDIKWWNELGIRGIGFRFLKGEINVYLGNSDYRSKINLSFNDNIFGLGVSHDFYKFGTSHTGVSRKILCIPTVKLEESHQIERNNSSIAQVLYQYMDFMNHHEFIKYSREVILSYKNEVRRDHVNFLSTLQQNFIESNFGIADLKFAIQKNGKMKILKPIDIVPRLEENDILINELIKLY